MSWTRKLRKSIPVVTAIMLGIGTISPGIGTSPVSAEQAYDLPYSSSLVEGFEKTDYLQASSVKSVTTLELASRPATIYYGRHAAKLSYDFTGTTGTSASYINFKDDNGSAGRSLPGDPKQIGVWVYGAGDNHWLRAQLMDSGGAKTAIDLAARVDWTGWKYITAPIPASMPRPLKITQIYLAETKDDNKNKGVLYVDQLSAFGSSSSLYGLDLNGLGPMQTGESRPTVVEATYAGRTAPAAVPASALTYSSSDESVASVDGSGIVQAKQAGHATITAMMSGYGAAAYAEVTVADEAPVPSELEVSGPPRLVTGSADSLRIYAYYGGLANPVSVLSGAAYRSSAPNAVEIDSKGKMKALQPGEAVLTAEYRGLSASLNVVAADPVPVLQSISLASLAAMNVGDSARTVVEAAYSILPAPVPVTEGVGYKSSKPEVASVDAGGLVTARSAGAAQITATFGGKTSSVYLVVSAALPNPKREMRAAWIATVDNVDWPLKGVTDADRQKRDYIALLDELKADGINAVIMQVKPTADAFYPSDLAPWSEWLTGKQGQDPGYDPLAFVLEEVHKRNMEFHAWFNPYRVSIKNDLSALASNNPAILHPEWRVEYGGKLYLNPAIPEAREYIESGIMEVVRGYDIDAVHFDDYFYPYPVAGVDFPDADQYAAYQASGGGLTKDDWRRSNVNLFVERMSLQIKGAKPYVKFGISPFGIWRNKSEDPSGSDTNGLSSYSAIYADTKTWIDEGWIDYVTPQIYWYMGYSPAAYEKLIAWWNDAVQGKNVHLYSGQAIYRIGATDGWSNPEEMPNQVILNRNYDSVQGSMYFSATQFGQNPLGFGDRLRGDLYRYPALIPVMPWLGGKAPSAPMPSAAQTADGVSVIWNADSSSDETSYVVYRFDGSQSGDIDDASHIAAYIRKQEGSLQTYNDRMVDEGRTYTYVVTAVDRLHRESGPSQAMTVKVGYGFPPGTPIPTSTPGPSGTPIPTTTPGPSGTPGASATPGPSGTPSPGATPEVSASPGPGWPGPAAPSSSPSPAPTATVGVIINGAKHDIALLCDSMKEGAAVSRLTFIEERLEEIAGSMKAPVIVVPVSNRSGTFIGELSLHSLEKLAAAGAVLEFRSAAAAFSVPAAAVARNMGAGLTEDKAIVEISISFRTEDIRQGAASQAAAAGAAWLAGPVGFGISYVDKAGRTQAARLDRFVTRSLAIADPAAAAGTAAGVRLAAGGSLVPVPTRVLKDETGQYWALLSSLTDGTFAVVTHSKSFGDTAGHWAQAAIGDLASRLVLSGRTDTSFAPDEKVSRAEFAAMAVRSLGLDADGAASAYSDVASSAWYAQAVAAAAANGLISGYGDGDGRFQPNRGITRAEAFVILNRAAELAGLAAGEDSDGKLGGVKDADRIPAWAQTAASSLIGKGLLQGYSDGSLKPGHSLTRAETAQMLQKLLIQAGLIDE